MGRYIILSQFALTDREWGRFWCPQFEAAGYEVVAVDLRSSLGLKADNGANNTLAMAKRAIDVGSIGELENLLESLTSNDIVLAHCVLMDATRPLFRLLRRFRVRYSSIDLGALPVDRMRSRESALSLSEYLALRWEELLGFLYHWREFLKQVAKYRFEYFSFQPPWLWLTAGEALKPRQSGMPRAWRARRIPVMSFDCLVADVVNTKPAVASRTAVFLDEAFCDHPDFDILGQKSPVTWKRYWNSMERLFATIEARSGVTVVIAPHPKASGCAPPDILSRVQEVGRTAELVRDCAFVLCHASTAVSYAVLFRKPLLFVTTDEVERSIYRGFIARMSSSLGLRRVNADHFTENELVPRAVDEKRYHFYERMFLRAPDADTNSPWMVLKLECETAFSRT